MNYSIEHIIIIKVFNMAFEHIGTVSIYIIEHHAIDCKLEILGKLIKLHNLLFSLILFLSMVQL